METAGKLLLIVGVALAVLGGVVWLLARMGFRGLPGDIRYETNGTTIYFPIVTCIVISIVATAILWIIQWLRSR